MATTLPQDTQTPLLWDRSIDSTPWVSIRRLRSNSTAAVLPGECFPDAAALVQSTALAGRPRQLSITGAKLLGKFAWNGRFMWIV